MNESKAATYRWRGHLVRIVGPREAIAGGTVVPVVNVGGYLSGLTYNVVADQLETVDPTREGGRS